MRIIQACRQLDLHSIAVYSAADTDALHVRLADEAIFIGAAPATDSYLNIAAILQAARESSAQAIHPGYGFLAENAGFARAVLDAGLIWIGPPPSVIALLGDKVASKGLAEEAGLPVVPGYSGDDTSADRMGVEAERIGYPVMLKAAAGGGGKGMRQVAGPDELPDALESARREATSAFGDDRVFLEKLIPQPRHVEIQIFLDAGGNGVYLGERDCSLQRRHQKVVEEAPSPVMTTALRTQMGEAALRLGRAAGYVNAGTVEFLFSGDQFYFLEVNARIQVEHPVTEMVTGLDLIRVQLEVAGGLPLPFNQLDVALRGHAIEARIYAEDAQVGFLPSTGPITLFLPPSGPGIRNDVGVQTGGEVTPYYDPMLAKLIVHDETRPRALARLQRALDRYVVAGPQTNLPFLRWLMVQPDVVSGRAGIEFIAGAWSGLPEVELPDEILAAAAMMDCQEGVKPVLPRGVRDPYSPWLGGTGWRASGVPRGYDFLWKGGRHAVTLVSSGRQHWRVETAERSIDCEVLRAGNSVLSMIWGGTALTFTVAETSNGRIVQWEGERWVLERAPALEQGEQMVTAASGGGLTSPMPGTVVKIAVQEGEQVTAHQPLVVLEAMKMEHVIQAPRGGTVRSILVAVGDMVPANSAVVQLDTE